MLSRRALFGASLPVLVLGSLPATVWARQGRAPFVRLTFNTDGVRRLLDLKKTKDVSETAINALLDLPAYKNVLRVGENEGSVTRERLAANARAVIQGTATPRNQPREDAARLVIANEEACRDLLEQLDDSAASRSARIAERLSAFTPEKVKRASRSRRRCISISAGLGCLNVGGDIFLNFHYWLEYNRPSLDGLNLVVAHETMHTVQNRAYGNPEAQETESGPSLRRFRRFNGRHGTTRRNRGRPGSLRPVHLRLLLPRR
jgi:hypothetical protein